LKLIESIITSGFANYGEMGDELLGKVLLGQPGTFFTIQQVLLIVIEFSF
jgi:hypothetical protein